MSADDEAEYGLVDDLEPVAHGDQLGPGLDEKASPMNDVWILVSAGHVGYGETAQEAINHWSATPPYRPRYFIKVARPRSGMGWGWYCDCGAWDHHFRGGQERAKAGAEEHAASGRHIEDLTVRSWIGQKP